MAYHFLKRRYIGLLCVEMRIGERRPEKAAGVETAWGRFKDASENTELRSVRANGSLESV